jgi:CheY-like chemotaxis protein
MDKSARVLFIDDDEDVVRFTRAFLKRTYAVDDAHDGREGVTRAREARPDVVVLDVMLDDIDEGFKGTRSLRADPDLGEVPVIMMSAVNRALRPRPCGTDDERLPVSVFLDKPVSPERLMVEIERLTRCH